MVPDFDDDDALKNLAALCQAMSTRSYARFKSGKEPEHLFGFMRSPSAYVDAVTGELHLGGAAGASCASFVLIAL